MSKWYGKIGYAESVEIQPGVWDSKIVERPYFGESIRINRMLQNSGEVIDNINVGNQISILADPYANRNFHTMIYVEFMGTLWKISNVDVQFPRLILNLGGIYNGNVYTPSNN